MMLPGCSLLEIKVTAPPKAKSMPIRISPLSRNVSLGAGIVACPPKVLRAQRAIAKQRQDSLLLARMGLVFINCFVLVRMLGAARLLPGCSGKQFHQCIGKQLHAARVRMVYGVEQQRAVRDALPPQPSIAAGRVGQRDSGAGGAIAQGGG